MPKIQFNHNKKISEYLKNKNGYDKRNHFIEITKIRNTRFTISWNEKYYQVIHIMRFFVFRNGQYTPQILPLFLPKTGIY
ncbi:conserved hypothetical protein [Flavobacterium psychrophilum]|nr:conserved hypothetical protein [Flavobacterium psychrophilum]SNB15157.1 conserved hypothetical protein [Flavobacterium psychrophilum]SNB22169.1 conserved hypothetical protein [Flavobacterium psychrophilum]GAQ48915.1 hypothetical protein FPK15_contig00021-0018 [Flavobacterium psychrophilum]GAW89421.1 hypothetical protein FPS14_contig00021-0024 [Flavobacterium psychrophilum]